MGKSFDLKDKQLTTNDDISPPQMSLCLFISNKLFSATTKTMRYLFKSFKMIEVLLYAFIRKSKSSQWNHGQLFVQTFATNLTHAYPVDIECEQSKKNDKFR